MNYIKEAENVLKYYRDLNRSIDHMSHEIGKLMGQNAPHHLTAVPLDPAGGIHGSGKDDTYNVLYKIKVLTENRDKTKAELDTINQILDEIIKEPGCEKYRYVLMEWYIHRTPKEEIAEEMPCSVRNVYRLRDEAIKKFALRYFGLEVLKII